MLGQGLSSKEIEGRLIRLRNLEYLHKEQKQRNEQLVSENRELKSEIARLNSIIGEQQKTIDDMKLQIEELRMMVFGKKKKNKKIDDDLCHPKEKIPRTNSSYKRPIPKDSEVTETILHSLDNCSCGVKCQKRKLPFFTRKIFRYQ